LAFGNDLGDLEDLAITTRSSRESDMKNAEDGDAVLSTTMLKEWRWDKCWNIV
jgi:hypothetical protein